ncbi:hypothetical protein LEN26_001830 [Aphanomyces euteiches]|nr:hypothetical protein AeMF1_005544 [Aphanomyces euteiches]KAH9160475.1 hypothetical protein LEN26_001830 [Aphanomyces euteiches]KAH9184741.1 hypothetical protein AeNC1_013282 [Aphanomyces euteiches]
MAELVAFCRRWFFGSEEATAETTDGAHDMSDVFAEECGDSERPVPPCASPNGSDEEEGDDEMDSTIFPPRPLKRTKPGSPPSDIFERVLLSVELLPLIAKFQTGAYLDILPFLKVRFCQCKTRRGLDRWVEYLEQLDRIFPPWYETYGFTRIRHLHRCVPKGPTRAVIHAASVGNLHAMRRLRRMYRFKLVLDDCIIAAVITGQFNVLQYLHGDDSVSAFPKHAMQYAAACGHLGLVQFLHNCRPEACGGPAMNAAAEFGQLRVLKWLHAHRNDGCNTWAMDAAAKYGHLEVVQWLHANREEGCTVLALEGAAERGHLAIVRFLREEVHLPWTRRALKSMLKWSGSDEVMQDAQAAAIEML